LKISSAIGEQTFEVWTDNTCEGSAEVLAVLIDIDDCVLRAWAWGTFCIEIFAEVFVAQLSLWTSGDEFVSVVVNVI
jgi:hypothetical protein